MSDEGRAGILALIWTVVFGAGLLSRSEVGYVIAAAVTVTAIIICIYDSRVENKDEELKKARKKFLRLYNDK